MSYEDGKVKMEGTLDTYKGNLTINILEALQELTAEQKAELVSDGGWWSFIEKAMAEEIVSRFSRDNYDEEYTRLRGMIINSEAMPSVIREWAVSLIESRERAKESEGYWNHAYRELYQYIREMDMIEIPKLPDHHYSHKYSDELMKEVEKQVQEWKMLFPEKLEEV